MSELRVKAIKGLEICSRIGRPNCVGCPYEKGCMAILAKDVLELLKTQEPKPPRFVVAYDRVFYACDNCGKSLIVMLNREGMVLQDDAPKYCPECGQEVKWS